MARDLSEKFAGQKLGLALGGGGARGVAHIGALKAFGEHNINFDFIAGTSVGSIVGACVAAEVSWEEMYQAILDIGLFDFLKWKRWELGYDSSTIAAFLESIIGKKNFNELVLPFSAIATNVNTARQKVFHEGDVSKAVRASCSIPGIFIPIKEDGAVFVDGGVVNNIPSNVARAMGADVVFAIDLNGELPETEIEGKLIETLYAVFNIMVRNNSRLGYDDADYVIVPKLKKYTFNKIDKAEEIFALGYQAVNERLAEIE